MTTWRREAAVAVPVFVLGALALTWPLALHPAGAIPTGGGPPTVALFGLFSMEWTTQALAEGASYWDAPFFHPHRGTFAWSETQPLTAGLVGLVSLAAGTVLAYNLVLWLYLTGFGLAGYALARQLTTDRTAALWAGLWLTGGAFSIQQLGVLHLLAAGFPLACLAALLATARNGRWSIAWAAGLAYLLTFLTSAQYGLFLTLLLPILLLALLAGQQSGERPKTAARLLTPLAAGLLLGLPWLLVQRARLAEMGFERPLVDVRGAYLPADLVLPAGGHWLTGRLLGWSEAPGAYPWDLGVVLLASIALAAALGAFRRRHLDARLKAPLAGLLLVSAVALLLGFGPHLALPLGDDAIVPYAWLHAAVPGLAGVRTPSRFGVFALAGVVAFAAVALAFLRCRVAAPRARLALTAAAFALLVAEMWAMPVRLAHPARRVADHGEVLGWLERHADGPLVDLPMSAGDGEAELEREVRAMLRALRHDNPVVNGYSGYFPEPFRQLRWALAEDPGGRGRRYLDALGVRHALIHHHEDRRDPERRYAALGGEVVFETERDTVVRLSGSPAVEPLSPPTWTPPFATAPRGGDLLHLAVTPTDRARLFEPGPGATLRVAWRDATGTRRTADVLLRGSVLVDARWGSLYVLLQRFAGERGGRGVLISEERVARRRGAARGR